VAIVSGAGERCLQPGAATRVAYLARDWFVQRLEAARERPTASSR
jgi:hypothetical protein